MFRRITSARAVAAAARNAVAIENLELRRLFSHDLAGTYIDTADGAAYEWFGSSVAVNGNLALVGSVGQSTAITTDGGENYTEVDTTAGQVTLIDTTDGTILQTFHNPVFNPQTGDGFGAGVAFVDGKIAITSPGSRAVYIYDDASDDVPETTYFWGTPETTGFGASVSVQGDDLLVGVLQTNETGDMNGAILRFDLDSASTDPAQVYINPEPPPASTVDQFGYNFTSDGTYIYSRVIQEGKADVVVIDNAGSLVATYHGTEGDFSFGNTLTASDGSLFINDPEHGAVHQVDTQGNLIQTFAIPSEVQDFTNGANGLAVSGGKLIAGAPNAPYLSEDEQSVNFVGTLYVYDIASGQLEESILNPGAGGDFFPDLADSDDFYGALLAPLPDGKFFVSALGENNANGIDAGTIYVYEPAVIPPTNEAPTNLQITGDSNVTTGQTANFTGSFTDADAGDSHTVAWDFGDGNTIAAHSTDDAGALTPSHVYTSAGPKTVTMTISDGVNDPVSTTFAVTAPPTNAAPTNLSIAGSSSAVRQQEIGFTGSFSDADAGDSHTVAWNFGDGNTIAAHSTTDAGALSVSHAYATAGNFTVTMTISDGVNAPVSTTFAVAVTASAVVGDTLLVGGTNTVDNIVLQKNPAGATVVTINGVSTTVTVARVVVMAGDGNDFVDASKSINAALEVYGGEGNDTIKAGGTGDIIVGNGGNDNLSGGKGRDVIIGGTGADSIQGDQDNDILIAGSTVHDADSDALNDIQDIWATSLSYTAAVNTLRTTVLRPDIDVLDDGAVDRLTGGAGQDWFVYQNGNDVIIDVKKDETATDL